MNKVTMIAAAACGVFALGLASYARAEVKTQDVDYTIAGAAYQGYLAYDDAKKGKRPGVVIYPAWTGISDNEKEHAQRLAKMGYVAFVADIYGKGVHPAPGPAAGAESGKYVKDRDLYRVHTQAGLDQLKKSPMVDPSRIAAIGYCFGAVGALELARSGAAIKDVVTFHVSNLSTPTPADDKNIKAHVLVLQGDLDPNTPAPMRETFAKEMNDAHLDWQFVEYSNTAHCYTDAKAGSDMSHGCAYNATSEKRSWEAMSNLFHDTL